MKNQNTLLLCLNVGVMLLTLSNWLYDTQKIGDTVFTIFMVMVIAVELVGLALYGKNRKKDSEEAK